MRFIVSDHLPGENRFGKWHYTHDNGIKSWSDQEKVVLWFGYTIEKPIEEIIEKDIQQLLEANGKFCVVILYKENMQVCLDYFAQTKVYYHTRDGLTVTNHLASLPLSKSDIMTSSIDHFMQGLGENVPMYACKDPMNMEWIYEWNNFSHDNTVFESVSSIPRDCWLEHINGETSLLKIHDTIQTNFDAFGGSNKLSDSEIENKIHQKVKMANTVIVKNIKTT